MARQEQKWQKNRDGDRRPRWEMLGLQIRQTNAAMGSWEAGLWSADAWGDSWGKGSLDQKGSNPTSSGLWHISLEKQTKECSVSSFVWHPHTKHCMPCLFSSAALALTACHCRFVFSGSWNPCTASSCHWGLHQCHKDATQLLYFSAFSRRSLTKKSALRNTM